METTSKIKIESLASVRLRKRQIKKELAVCEGKIQEDYFKFTHPIAFLLRKDSEYDKNVTPLEAAGSLALKLKQYVGIAGVAFSVFNMIRGFRRK